MTTTSSNRPGRARSKSVEPVRALDRGLEILNVLAESGGGTLSEVSKAAGLVPSTVYRLLETVIPFAEWVKNTEKTEVLALIDFGRLPAGSLTPGTVNAATGQAAYDYIVGSIDAAREGRIDGVATGPIHKEALRAAGVPQPGHTEIFAERSKAVRACMMLTSPKITCSFATTHIGYRDVPGALSIERVLAEFLGIEHVHRGHLALLEIRSEHVCRAVPPPQSSFPHIFHPNPVRRRNRFPSQKPRRFRIGPRPDFAAPIIIEHHGPVESQCRQSPNKRITVLGQRGCMLQHRLVK